MTQSSSDNMSIPMKILLENKKRYAGTKLEYPYPEVDGVFNVAIVHHPHNDTCCVRYLANKGNLKEKKEKIEEICRSAKISHGFGNLEKKLFLHTLPVNYESLYFLTIIDKHLGLPVAELDENKS